MGVIGNIEKFIHVRGGELPSKATECAFVAPSDTIFRSIERASVVPCREKLDSLAAAKTAC
jgi:hypothetical protein